MGCRGTTALRVRLPCLGNRLDRQADGVDADGGHGEGEVLEVALVGLDAVDEALVVVVDGGGGSREGVEVAEEGVAAVFEVAMLPVELTEEDGGDVEIGKGGGADIGVEDVGGGVGVPGCDDVEADGEVGILDVPSVGAPLEGLELDEDGGRLEGCFLLDELDLAVPEVAVLEQGLGVGLLVGDGEELLFEGEVEVLEHGCCVC